VPTKNGYTFGGWYEDYYFTNPFDFSTIITSDLVLYAKWAKTDEIDTVQMLRDSISELNDDISTLTDDNARLQIDSATLANDNDRLQIDSATLADDNARLQIDSATLADDIARLQIDSATLADDIARLQIDSATLANDIARLYDTILARDNTIANLKDLLDLCQNSSNQELLAIIEGLKADTLRLNSEVETLIIDTLRLHNDNTTLITINNELKTDTANLNHIITVRDETIADLQDQLALCQSGDNSELYERIEALINDTVRLHGDNTTLTIINNELKTDTANLNAQIAALQAQLANCGNGNDELLQQLQDSIQWLELLLAECGNPNITLNPVSEIDVHIYPNPVVDILHIDILGNHADYTKIVELYDMLGKRVYLGRIPTGTTQLSINMTPFRKGHYILRIGNRMAKIIKN
jgi:uncharacterized repeat protein (TIGR02543 family)